MSGKSLSDGSIQRPNDPIRLESIFQGALAITSLKARAVYLDEACHGSPNLRDEIESLLFFHEQPDGLLLPAHGVSPPLSVSPPNPGGADNKMLPNTCLPHPP
jgi:hypothetical protein